MNLTDLQNLGPWEWPENTRSVIETTLRDRASADRQIAAELGGDLVVVDDQMADLLLSIVLDTGEPEELRARAAISLGPVLEQSWTEGYEFDIAEPPIEEATYDRLREGLRRVYDDPDAPKLLRRRAMEAVVRAPDDWQEQEIHLKYASSDEEWRLTAVFSMQYIDGDFEKEIQEALESPNPDIRLEGVRAAGARGVKSAWPHIHAVLDSKKPSKWLLLAAIQAAAEINPEEALLVLHEFTHSKDEDIAESAQEAIDMAQMELEAGDLDDDEEEAEEDEE